jgi:hypothetical protein
VQGIEILAVNKYYMLKNHCQFKDVQSYSNPAFPEEISTNKKARQIAWLFYW